MGKVISSELVLKGSDQTGAMFAGVIRHAEELKRMMGGLKGMSLNDPKLKEAQRELRMQTRLVREQNAAWRAVNDTLAIGNKEAEARIGIMRRAADHGRRLAHASGLGWMIGGMASGALAHRIADDTAEVSHQRAMLSVGGMSRADVKEALARAYAMRVPGMSAAENLKAIGELRMVFGSTEEALRNVAAVQRGAAALGAMNPGMNASGEAYNLARSLELKGISQDPAHFNRLNNALVKAINATHGKVNGEEFLSFSQRAGSGVVTALSDKFFSQVAPTLIQEMHGSTAGRALSTLQNALVGGHMTQTAASEWMRLGLLDRHKVEFTKIGTIKKVHPGALQDSELFVSNPYEWIHKYLAPELKKHGIVGEKKTAIELATLFSDRYAKNMATILLTQKQRIEKDRANILSAMGTDAAGYARSHDAIAAARDIAAATDKLLGAFGGPLAKPAIAGMNTVSDWFGKLGAMYGHFQEKHPLRSMAASGAGVAGLGFVALQGWRAMWGLATAGPALNASATALDGSAAALTDAAGALGTAAKAEVAKGASPSFTGWGAVPGVATALSLWQVTQEARERAKKMPVSPGETWGEWWANATGNGQTYERERLTPLNSSPLHLLDISGALSKQKAELSGEAHVKISQEIKTEPGFWSSIKSTVSNAIDHLRFTGPDTGSTGSTGHSMPETGSHQ